MSGASYSRLRVFYKAFCTCEPTLERDTSMEENVRYVNTTQWTFQAQPLIVREIKINGLKGTQVS